MRDLPPPPSPSQYHSHWYFHSQSDPHTSLYTYFPQHPDPSPDRTHSTTSLDLYHLRLPQAYNAPRYTYQYHATQVAIPSYGMAIIPLEGKNAPSPRECSFPPSFIFSLALTPDSTKANSSSTHSHLWLRLWLLRIVLRIRNEWRSTARS